MKIRLTLVRPGRPGVDLCVTCDASTTVADVAEYLYLADPTNQSTLVPAGLTIGVAGSTQHALDPDAFVADCGLQSGQHVTLARAGQRFGSKQQRPAAMLTVVDGPDKGQEFPLLSGSNTLGRGRGCQVRFSDPMVSRQHARINVTDTAEVMDLGSANGITINEEAAERRNLRVDDRVRLGDTVFTVRMLQLAGAEGRVEGAAVAFIRSPRLTRVYPGREFEAPEPPDRPALARFPVLTLIAPILMAGIMYAVTRNLLSLIFIALSPIMMVGSYLENRFATKGAIKAATKQFRADLAGFVADLESAQLDEVQGRLAEQPSVDECADAVDRLSPLLWTRRTDLPGFCQFRLGLGTQPTRHEIQLPSAKRAPRDLYAELTKALEPHWNVHGVPIVADPGASGGLGVAGPRAASLAVARALMVQAVSLHSPTELVIAAVASERTADDWDFLKWLPHNQPAHSPLSGDHLAGTSAAAVKVVAECEELVKHRAEEKRNDDQPGPPLPVVLLLVESDSPVAFSRLVGLAESGWKHGVYVLWVAPEVAQLPASCRTFVDASTAQVGGVGYLHTGEAVAPVQLETIGADRVEALARRMAPVTDLATRAEDASDLPRNVSFLALAGAELASNAQAVIERWRENRSITVGPYAPNPLPKKAGNLRGVLGQSASGFHALDLRVDGPHALVGGTTGSGKSELLQTWILAMAATNSPQRLNFLLVDYKGGSAFAECNKLPHTVGLVTDLNPNGVRRALTSLAAELRYREHLFEQYQAKDLVALEKSYPAVAPPSLVIVVDEFAALVQEVPEFVDGVVNVAQRGRSLGLHLILATQRPAGVIKGNLRANTNLRLALRVADIEDSNDVIDSPMAAYFDQELPGRAVSKTGPGRYVTFQTGYVGGHTGAVVSKPDIVVEELSLVSRARWERPVIEEPTQVDLGPTDIARLVETISSAYSEAALPVPRKPWLPELAMHYSLGSLPTARRDDCLVFGIQDDANAQAQPTVAFYPDTQGNMAIYGAGGSGKSTLLRTLAAAAGFTVRGGPCHVYGIDFGSRALAMLEDLPHVGSIVSGSDDERIQRTLTWLRATIDDRSQRYSAVNAATICEYRTFANMPDEPRILLLVDGIAAFRSAYEGTLNNWLWELLISIASEGRPVGVHVVLTADRMNAISTALASAMQSRLVLRMTDQNDYSFLNVPSDILTPKSPPGRGILDGREIQVAMLGKSADNQAQAVAMQAFSSAMAKAGIGGAMEIRRLPEEILASTLPTQVNDLPVVGMRSSDLEPQTFNPKGAFLVVGPPGSGRTTATRAVRAALVRQDSAWATILLTPRRTDLAGESWRRTAVGAEQVDELCRMITEELKAGKLPQRVAIFVESVTEFIGSVAESALSELVTAVVANDLFVVVEGEVSTLASGYNPLLNTLRSARAGIALQPESNDGTAVFKTDFPARLKRGSFPVGRGLVVGRGRTDLSQIMLPD